MSILSLGTFLGALTAAPVADFFGRRMGIFLSSAIVFNLGVVLQVIATSQPLFIAGRFGKSETQPSQAVPSGGPRSVLAVLPYYISFDR